MADYYPLLARAIGGLPNKSGDARRVVFERARRALITQLRGAEPPLADSDIVREQHALEDAIRRLEAEYGAPVPAPETEPPGEAPAPTPVSPPAPVETAAPEPESEPASAPEPQPAARQAAPSFGAPVAAPEPSSAHPSTASVDDEDDLYAAALGAPSPRLAADRRDPRGLPADDFVGLRPAQDDGHADPFRAGGDGDGHPASLDEQPDAKPGRGRLIAGVIVVLLLIAGAAVGYTQREAILALMGRTSSTQATSIPATAPTGAPAPELTKSTDRIVQAPSDGTRAASTGTSQPAASQGQGVGVAQRAVLFEESPGGGDQGLQQYVGNVVWETETFSPGQGMASDIGIRGTITIPDRNIKAVLRVRRNQDASIPASHIIEVQFDLPPDFDLGPVANVPGIRSKAVESASGAPLTGISVKVAPGYFLIGLSSLPQERQRNLGMLITRNWLDIPTVFENGRRAILVLEKGVPGDQAFRQAFSAWGLPLPPQTEPAN
ncbi:hypothetical protein [Ancylobacter pratisalsi]|uniref:Uncharacterized protein n=1 Tax=Ancylobacter pratisalsi TaxID=1745854 RepID=A0A6P1YK42_9HYPH|nr:hypothetical protein [Ancylobacter pratisalsi]QIB33330.1 hypothetical protein G3A50_06100 [Ancylobacter pratisalsi]